MKVKLSDAFDLQMGKTPPRNDRECWGDGHKWISISDIGNAGKYIDTTKEEITDIGVSKSGIKVVPKGTVIMSFKLSIGKTAITAEDMYTNEAIMAFINKGKYEIDTDYLYHMCKGIDWFEGTNKAVLGLTLNKATMSEKTIEIPPMEVQQQVVAVLDKMDELITMRKEQLAKLDQLVKSRFIELFGNFVYEHDRWPVCEVGDVADTIDPQPSHRTPPISADGIPYIGIAECNYKTRLIDFEKARKVGQNVLQEHLERYKLDEGDFIIGKIGTIGKPFFVPAEQTYTLSANTVLIKPRKGQVVPQFLFAVFQSEYMDRIIDAEKKSTSQPAFGIQKVRKIDIPMPPIELQEQFAAFVEQTDKSKLAIQQSLNKLELLKKSLMQEYFG